jgi:hypothetical protein
MTDEERLAGVIRKALDQKMPVLSIDGPRASHPFSATI